MKLIILNRGSRPARTLNFSAGAGCALAASIVAVVGMAAVGGYSLAVKQSGLIAADEIVGLQADLETQRARLQDMQSAAEEQIDGLALRMGELNANVIRLNALGRRLTGIADLDEGEFDFQNSPALGGPVEGIGQVEYASDVSQLPDLLNDFSALELTLDDQQQQLVALETLLMDQKLRDRVKPKGRPVTSGWLSSYYGKRIDPITGKSSWHKGIDFAGQYGNDVVAVGDGVVSWSGDRFGYGNLVEIKHGNGFVTRYAHNQENLVAVGDQVNQGEVIALMGSTGRSTGPHVHFEVWRNGRPVDPAKYIQSR